MMPDSDPRDRFFCLALTPMIDPYSIAKIVKFLHGMTMTLIRLRSAVPLLQLLLCASVVSYVKFFLPD